MIFESHAHYDDKVFEDDREELLASLSENGIGYVVNVGASIGTSKETLKLMEKYEFVYGALGVHPSATGELNEKNYLWLKEQCISRHRSKRQGKVVAVGEIGLDYYWDEPERQVQKEWFERQLEMAEEVKLPVIVHSREAAKETLDILRKSRIRDIGGVMHCYSYSKELAKDVLELGLSFGIGGVVTFSNAKKVKEAVEYIPMDRILLETDCPYLAPVPFRGKRNSSLYLPLIAKEIARIKGMNEKEVLEQTTRNALQLFQI